MQLQTQKYDESRYFLGKLCKNGHDFDGTGYSLRQKHGKEECMDCRRSRRRKIQQKESSENAQKRYKLELQKSISTSHAIFDASRFYLGVLCSKKHDWQDTGYSLRHKHLSKCAACNHDTNAFVFNLQTLTSNCLTIDQLIDQTKRLDPQIDTANYFLGRPCKNQHLHVSGYSIRRLNKHGYPCPECLELAKINNSKRAKDFYEREGRDKYKQWYSDPSNANARNSQVKQRYRTAEGRKKAYEVVYRRLARKKQVLSENLSYEDRESIKDHFQGCCAYCCANDKKLEIDHFIPLSRGGPDILSNLVPACDSCNSSKWAHHPYDWYMKQTFFSVDRWLEILSRLGVDQETIGYSFD